MRSCKSNRVALSCAYWPNQNRTNCSNKIWSCGTSRICFLFLWIFFSTGAGAQQVTMVPKSLGKMMLILFLGLGTDLFGIWENTKLPHLWKAAQWAQLKLPFLPSGQSQSFFNLVRAQVCAELCQKLKEILYITWCICGCRKRKLVW